jgi:hypothetical protein
MPGRYLSSSTASKAPSRVDEVAPSGLVDAAGFQYSVQQFRVCGVQVDETGGVADRNRYIVLANPNIEQAAVGRQFPV